MKPKIDLLSAKLRGTSRSKTPSKRKLSLISESKLQSNEQSPGSYKNSFTALMGCLSSNDSNKKDLETLMDLHSKLTHRSSTAATLMSARSISGIKV